MSFFKQMNRRVVAATAVSAGLLVPLGILGAPALARTASSANAYQYQYQYKVAICHRTHSKKHPWHAISVGAPAVAAHLRNHHDFLITPTAPCPPVTPAAPTTSTSSTHGNSGNHGNNGKAKGHGK